jgi:hypothetical protein
MMCPSRENAPKLTYSVLDPDSIRSVDPYPNPEFWSSKPWMRIDIQPKMLDKDPDQMNTDPKHRLYSSFWHDLF